jgi:predicted XRE-type DNA-binding protein
LTSGCGLSRRTAAIAFVGLVACFQGVEPFAQVVGDSHLRLGSPVDLLKQTRVRLAVAINQIIEVRRLSQSAAARLLDINQPKISALVNYRLEEFSVERLMHFLNALDRDVEIVIRRKPRSKRAARIVVTGTKLSHVV